MVQDQLVDYISSQIKTGVSRDAIKASLVGAGWQAADVEDTLKKVEAPKTAAPTVSAAQPAASPKPLMSSSSAASSTAPQTIKVSDLVSAPGSAAPLSSFTGKTVNAATKGGTTTTAATMNEFPGQKKERGSFIVYIILAVLVVGAGAFAAYLYLQNNSLAAKVASLGGQSAGVTSNIATLNTQVQALNASNTALTMQVASFTAENQELQTELSFFAVPPGTTATSTPLTMTGMLSGGGKVSYALTAMYGSKIYIENSKDPNVVAALQPLVGTSTELSGTYVPGADQLTVTSVNGSSL